MHFFHHEAMDRRACGKRVRWAVPKCRGRQAAAAVRWCGPLNCPGGPVGRWLKGQGSLHTGYKANASVVRSCVVRVSAHNICRLTRVPVATLLWYSARTQYSNRGSWLARTRPRRTLWPTAHARSPHHVVSPSFFFSFFSFFPCVCPFLWFFSPFLIFFHAN
jgi:hypothetical protein